ncbi:MAG: MATE family efflux transporter [bacterium]|nr:MATE family efflux transporter [bacterium]
MKKEFDLGHDNINKLLISFAIPCVISMLINSVYNIVDQIFIGKGVGTLGNAATNVIFPLVILANAIAGLIGNGAAANLSLKLGEKKQDDAKQAIGSSLDIYCFGFVFLSSLYFLT